MKGIVLLLCEKKKQRLKCSMGEFKISQVEQPAAVIIPCTED